VVARPDGRVGVNHRRLIVHRETCGVVLEHRPQSIGPKGPGKKPTPTVPLAAREALGCNG
jgi:hypothetical protein